jgi:serine/threonine protein kinase
LLALIHAHNKNIIHRDIKPDNVFILNQSGVRLHVRVLDFGIARIMRGDESSKINKPLTEPGAVMGTPRYMAPEQLAGQPADARSDLYSAALVIHEALTGKPAFVTGKTLQELCPDASTELCDLIHQCLNPNPNGRPNNALEVYLRILEFGKASGILLLPPGAMEKLAAVKTASKDESTVTYIPRLGQKSRQWLWIAAAVACLGIAALIWWLAT